MRGQEGKDLEAIRTSKIKGFFPLTFHLKIQLGAAHWAEGLIQIVNQPPRLFQLYWIWLCSVVFRLKPDEALSQIQEFF